MSPASPMYRALADYYDLIYGQKDYRKDTADLVRVARKFGRSGGNRWLDVACGTGRHLELLRRKFRVLGVDQSPEMLRIARRRLPGVPLVRADMRRLDLGKRFDVVSCLFSAIGYLRTEADLRRALNAFARHLRPGGVLLVQPWIDPAHLRRGHVTLSSHHAGPVAVARASWVTVRGSLTRVHFDYLIAREGQAVQHLRETEVLRMTPPARLVELAREAGLAARLIRSGPKDERGLLVAVAPPQR
jgi:ubiquinone/menaquinone biosynthesis C-methylase UbiE